MLVCAVACHPFYLQWCGGFAPLYIWKIYGCTLYACWMHEEQRHSLNKKHICVRRVELQTVRLSCILFHLFNGITQRRLLQTLPEKRNTAFHLWEKKL